MSYKAVFIDYTGTMVEQTGDDFKKLVKIFCTHSDLKEPMDAVAYVWKLVKKYEGECNHDKFITELEIVDTIVRRAMEEHGLDYDIDEIKRVWEESWIHEPLFDDVRGFFEKSPLPIYMITNDGVYYAEKSMEEKGLKPAGIISADMVRAYKPCREIFEKALEVAGCKPEEAVHIGDSVVSDVEGASTVGIQPVLIDRSGKEKCDKAIVVKSLDEVINLIK